MASRLTLTTRPQRWQQPFDPQMEPATIDRLLQSEPFKDIDESLFPATLPLRELIAGDTRVVDYRPGQVIFREGDYGASAFLILHGQARVALDSLSGADGDKVLAKKAGWMQMLARVLRKPSPPEARGGAGPQQERRAVARPAREGVVFLQDIPAVLDTTETIRISPGELFGEFGALTRMPRPATVFAEKDCLVLEMRWQGLRDMMRYTPALSDYIHTQYRENHLRRHLREMPLLANLSDTDIQTIADATKFTFHGNFEWQSDLDSTKERTHPPTLFERVSREPVVAKQGNPVDELLMIRAGFARVSVRRGAGLQTSSYLGRGQVFGVAELARESLSGVPTQLTQSLHAIGYLDLLRIPKSIVFEKIFPSLDDGELEQHVATLNQHVPKRDHSSGNGDQSRTVPHTAPLGTSTLDFLVDNRFMNGTEAMVIDLDRCTRCDDCVRACAATHGGNPRFVRQGPVHDQFQYTNACMHCIDPVCMIGCPTGAIHRDAMSGVVQINDPTCIGCSMCADSCPYDNIRMVDIRDSSGALMIDEPTGQPVAKATKCDLCYDTLTGPSCQNACPHDALVRIDISNVTPLTDWASSSNGH